MPAAYFLRLRSVVRNEIKRTDCMLQGSLEGLIGEGRPGFRNYSFFHSSRFSGLADSEGLSRTGTVLAASSEFLSVNQGRNISSVGAFSRTISVPSVSGPAFRGCGYYFDCALVDSCQIPPVSEFQSNPMAASGSRVVIGGSLADSLNSKHGHLSSSTRIAAIFYGNRSSNSCIKPRMSLENHEKPNNGPLYGHFMFSVGKRWCNFNLSSGSGSRAFHSSLPSCLLARTAPDVSFGSSGCEEQVSSSVSSEVNISAGKTLKLLSGSCYLPHPDKEDTGGEDAHFICVDEQAIGIADGVGGWADMGVDSGEYSRELMSNSMSAIQEEPKGSIDLARVLEKAHSSTKAKGSSTACVIALRDQGLHAINLGDSGFMVVRDGHTICRSPVLQHDFNFPYQLENGSSSDLPSSGQIFAVPVAPGDVIIAGTDGLFDNLYDSDITAVVVHAVRAGFGPQVTAQKIAALARERAQDTNRQTPFSTAAQNAGFRYTGGKLDDITVVVSYITSSEDFKDLYAEILEQYTFRLYYSHRKTFMDPSSSLETPRRNSDIDFKDVFGGPPRLPSIQETRYSFGGNNTDSSSAFKRSDEPVRRNLWSGLRGKLVFGEEGIGWSRRSTSDFFNDIFRGNESSSSSPRTYEMKDPFEQGLQLMSPPRPLPPADFRHSSLLAQLNKRMDLPTFGSSTRTKSKSNDGSLNDLSYHAHSSNEDSRSTEISKNGSQFHFSIHRWANKGGIPVVIPPRGSYRLKEKDKLQRWSSANGRSTAKEPRDQMHNRFRSIDEVSSKFRSFRVEHDKNEHAGFLMESRNVDGKPGQITDEAATHKPEPKTLNSLLDDDNEDEHGNDGKDVSEMSAEKLSEILEGKNSKKQDVKKRVEASTTSIKHFPRKSWDNGKARVRGKVKEFIKFFNQDATSKPRTNAALSENHGSSWKERDPVKPENESNNSVNKRVEKIHLNNMLKKKSYSDIPVANRMYNAASEKNHDSSVRVSDDSKTVVKDPAELFEDNFLMEGLTPEEKISPQFGIDPEEIKVIDDKIRQWSNGKQSNIHSLLSTLQYVLWPGSGWKPVPLVDIIEGPAVKRSYQKALLCLHPDKLQQKGAAADQKYIAQQVFDILQVMSGEMELRELAEVSGFDFNE